MPTILVVDDQAEARKPLMRLLQHAGYTAMGAADAYEALAATNREQPDLILLDVQLPPMDGLTFLMLLRDNARGRNTPVILVTGLSDDHTIARAQALGVKEYLVKSQFTPEELLALVRKHVTPPVSPAVVADATGGKSNLAAS